MRSQASDRRLLSRGGEEPALEGQPAMHWFGISPHFVVKLLLGIILLVTILIVSVGCTTEMGSSQATDGLTDSSTPEPTSAAGEAPSPTVTSSTSVPTPTATPNLPPTSPQTQTSQRDRVWFIQCDEDWLVDYIIDLSEERESTSSDIIMWFEPGTIREVGRTTTLVRCRAVAEMLSTPDTYITVLLRA